MKRRHLKRTRKERRKILLARHRSRRCRCDVCLLEVTEVDLRQVPAAQRLAQWRQTPGPAARGVVHAVGQTAERLRCPRSAYHQVGDLGDFGSRRVAQLVQTPVKRKINAALKMVFRGDRTRPNWQTCGRASGFNLPSLQDQKKSRYG